MRNCFPEDWPLLKRGTIAALGLATLVFCGAAGADTLVARYFAGFAGNPLVAPSPGDLGFVFGAPGGDVQNFASEAVSPDGDTGHNAWRMLDNSTATGRFITWTHAVDAAAHQAGMENGWTLAARLRVEDPVADNAGGRSVLLSYGNGARRWLLFFDINADGHLVATFDGSSPAILLDDLDAGEYHEHQLVREPGSNSVDYLVNGQVRFSGYTGTSNGFNGLQFGTGSSAGRGDGYWNEVAFAVNDPAGSDTVPVVVAQPQDRVAAAGSTVLMEAEFSGAVTGYQWFRNGEPVTGGDGPVLVLDPLDPADGGDYWCRASNEPENQTHTRTAVVAVLQAGAGLRVTEFLASNEAGLRDEDGDRDDWIEIFNGDTEPVSTAGWHLSDDPGNPLRWPLPEVLMAPGEFRVIHASGKDRRDPQGVWHTDFSLARAGEHVILTRPDSSVATFVAYPEQQPDISYGLTWTAPYEWRFFEPPAPGEANRDGRHAATGGVLLDPPPGMFSGELEVTASAVGGPEDGVLRFTSDGSRPDAWSPIWDGALNLTESTALRVALVAPGERFGISASAAYLRRDAGAGSFSSPLPLVVLSNFGAGEVPGISASGPNRDGSQVVQVEPQVQVMTILNEPDGGPVTLASPAVTQTRAGLRRRGSSSFSFSRRSYRLHTYGEIDRENNNIPLLGMPEENDWVLYAPDSSQFDITLIHNAFSYELARRSGFNAPRFRWVEVFLDTNGDGNISMADHRGLYLLVETVKRDSSRVPFPQLSDDGTKGGWMINVDRMDSLPPGSALGSLQPRQFHTAGPDGILQTADDVARGTSTSDDQPNFYHSFFNFDSPRGWDILPGQQAVIQEAVRAFDAALYGPDYRDPDHGWAAHIDARNWAHHMAIHQIARNQDAVVLSSFLYRETPAAPIRWASVWDFDRAYARMDTATSNLTWAHNRMFYERLFTDPEFRQVHLDTWQDLRRGAFSSAEMHALVDELAAEITPEVAARSGISASQWQTNLDNMKSWLATRAAAIDAFDPAPPVITPPGGPIVGGLAVEMAAPAGTIHYTTDGSDPRISGGGVSPAAAVYNGTYAPAGPVTITARVLSGGSWSGLTSAVFFPAEDGPRFLPGGNAAWNVDEHWESAPQPHPNGQGQAAAIGRPETGNRTVTLQAPVVIGSLWFDGADSPFRNRLSGASPNTLTFSSGNGDPANLRITGDGLGFVEFDLNAGVVLADDLILDVTHLTGDPDHGAVRLRGNWTGLGGLIKRGAGLASLTGGGKSYTGATRIENGVLQFTEPATPGASESLVVWPGGQLRLVSGGTREYLFGGAIELSGGGRGDEIPDGEGQGKLGALRYEPGAGENHGTITHPVVLAADTHIHVATEGNRLTLSGGISGAGCLIKSGGGTLALNGAGVHPSSLEVANGTLEARGMSGGPVVIGAGSVFDAAGVVADISGAGVLRPAADGLIAGNVSDAAVDLLFAPGLVTLTANTLSDLERVDVFLEAPLPGPGDRLTGGIVLPTAEAWNGVNFAGMQVFTPDAAGSREFGGRTWSPVGNATATRVPSALPGHPGSVLELRFDGAPLGYEIWVAATFPAQDDREDPGVSGPAASPFGDGVANLLRFTLGTDDKGRVRLPTLDYSSDGGVFRFPYDPGLRGLRWVVEATDDLTHWAAADVLFDSDPSESPPEAGGWLDVADPATDRSRRFYRLRIGLQAP